MLYTKVLHVSVHQHHHRAPCFQESNNIRNLQICNKGLCLTVYLVCISAIPAIFVILLQSFIFKEEANTNDRRKTAKDSLFMKVHTQQWILIYTPVWYSVCAFCTQHMKEAMSYNTRIFYNSISYHTENTDSPMNRQVG
jgi:hypothetical protein